MKILAIGAHADDVEIGCGGSLAKWSDEGHDITIFTATNSAYTGPDGTLVRSAEAAATEAAKAAEIIGASLITGPFDCFSLNFAEPLNATLLNLVEELNPDMVLTHWEGDTHPDHQALSKASLHVSRRAPSVLMYASNWYAGTASFEPRFYVDISEYLERKLELIAVFKSELNRVGDSWARHCSAQATAYGLQTGCAYAEGFRVVKHLMA